jgi:hypothetical protein
MTRLDPNRTSYFTLVCAITVLIADIALSILWPLRSVRATAGSLGLFAAVVGSGFGIWCSVRLRNRVCYAAEIMSIRSLMLWAWLLWRAVHDWRV